MITKWQILNCTVRNDNPCYSVSKRINERLPLRTCVTTHLGRQWEREGDERMRQPVYRFTSVEPLISTWWLAVCLLYGRRRRGRLCSPTTIYYECHTNTRQRSNFVIESKPLSTYHIADPSRSALGRDGRYSHAVRTASRPDRPRRRAVHRRCPGTDRPTEPRQ